MTTIRILSAGAVKEGLRKSAELFTSETGQPHEIEFATGPVIKERVLSGKEDVDLIAMPQPGFDDLIAAGKVSEKDIALLGFVTVGVTVRNGAWEPDLSTVDAFIESVLSADRIIYNTASSGQYVAKTLEKLGLADKIAGKVSIAETGKAAMEALAADTSGKAIGFGHATEIRLHDFLGTHLVGPLPEEIGRQTPYAIGLQSGSSQTEEARQMIELMISQPGRQIFLDTGVLQAG